MGRKFDALGETSSDNLKPDTCYKPMLENKMKCRAAHNNMAIDIGLCLEDKKASDLHFKKLPVQIAIGIA